MTDGLMGGTGIRVSRLCFGTLTMGPLQSNLPLNVGADLLELAFSLGVNFIDTAELYGTYPYIREALRVKPDAVVCTKAYAYDAATAEASFRAAVKGIGREYIDMFLLHEQESAHTIRGHWGAIEYMLKRKREGYIGALGISTHHVAAVMGANTYPELEIVFPLINMSGIGIADGSARDMLEAINAAHARKKGIFAMKPLGGGHLIGKREAAFGYLLGMDSITSIAVGMQSEAEVRYNSALFSGQTPDAAVCERVDTAKRRLIIHSWCEGCGACVKRCKSDALRLDGAKASVIHEHCVLCGYCAAVCPQFCIKVI